MRRELADYHTLRTADDPESGVTRPGPVTSHVHNTRSATHKLSYRGRVGCAESDAGPSAAQSQDEQQKVKVCRRAPSCVRHMCMHTHTHTQRERETELERETESSEIAYDTYLARAFFRTRNVKCL